MAHNATNTGEMIMQDKYRMFRCVDRNVIVGVVQDRDAHGTWVLSAAAQVRYWGTTKGIGELSTGPTAKTIVDLFPLAEGEMFEVHADKIIYSWGVVGWGGVLK